MGWVNSTNSVNPYKLTKKMGWIESLGEFDFQKWKLIQNDWLWINSYPIHKINGLLRDYFSYFL